MIPDRYKTIDAWPHEFAPDGKDFRGDDGKMWRRMECTFCHKKYMYCRDQRPIGECPSRNNKKEKSRLFR